MTGSGGRVPDSSLTILTGADSRYWRSLRQFLRSVARVGWEGIERLVVFDLGLRPSERAHLERRFPAVLWRALDLARFPPHVQPSAETCAWKPVLVDVAAREFGGFLLWLDSATVLKRAPSVVVQELGRSGVYAPKGQSLLFDHCHEDTLRRLRCDPAHYDRPERAAGACGFDTGRADVRALIERWKEHALDAECIAPASAPSRCSVQHKWEQAVLSVLLYEREARTGLVLTDDEVDISSTRPAGWLSTRNKVPLRLPPVLDPLVRPYYAAWKAADRLAIRAKRFHRTRIEGLHRYTKERFEVRVRRADGRSTTVPSRWSRYLADPFLVRREGRAQLFVEEYDHLENRGRISVLAVSDDLACGPPVPVIEPPYHVSFPFPFEHAGRLFLLPESSHNRTLDLYECVRFPDRFRLRRRLFGDIDAADSTLFDDSGRFWLFTSVRDASVGNGRYLCVFHARDIDGPWQAHPVNRERRFGGERYMSGRCAGAPVRERGAWLRPIQHNPDFYGQGLRWQRIVRLDEHTLVEETAEAPAGFQIPDGRHSHHVSSDGTLLAFDERTRRRG